MDNWKHIIIACVVTILVTTLASLVSGFKTLKIFLVCFVFSTLGFGIAGLYGRKSNNRGVDGDWGAHGLWKEIFNLETVTVSIGAGLFITLIFMLVIYFDRK
jgi:ABC-type Fe3+ transport system permease subunit